MTIGYTWHPILRQVPTDGGEVITDLITVFTDPVARFVQIKWALDQTERMDFNRVDRSFVNGFRIQVKFKWQLFESQWQNVLADVTNRMARSRVWETYLSMDAGATFNRIKINDFSGPVPIQRHTVLGGEYELDVSSCELVDEIPYLAPQYAVQLTAETLLTLPPPSRYWKGHLRLVEGANGTDDQMWACGKNAAGVYLWVPVATFA